MVELIDLTFRDGQQSKLATRLRVEDMTSLMEKMDKVGFYATEVWGGAIFDSCIRYLNEDPWERLNIFRDNMPNTKLMMLMRAMNLVGYRNYPDDIVKKFIDLAHKNGIQIFRIFDALNDLRNMKVPIEKAKEVGAETQGALCYTTGPGHTLENYVEKFKKLEKMGVNSLCIKDMAGIISPKEAFRLIKRTKDEGVEIPIDLHSHTSSGMAPMAFERVLDAEIDILDTVFSPMANGTSHPPTESVVAALRETRHDTEYDWDLLMEIRKKLTDVMEKYRHLKREKAMITDPSALTHTIPGGMLSNLMFQLSEMNMEDRYYQVLEEVSKVRAELGYPPLVTPISQIVGTQATMNVKTGERYRMISHQVKDYVRGMYGRTSNEISEKIKEKILGKDWKDQTIRGRPAGQLEPEFEKRRDQLEDKGLPEKEEDVLTYALFPEKGLEFLKNKAEPKSIQV